MSDRPSENEVDMLIPQLVATNMPRLTSSDAPHLKILNARYVDLDRCCPLDSIQHSAGFALPPENTLGALNMLPLELSTQVLLSMDLTALTTFRRVNQCARELVDSLLLVPRHYHPGSDRTPRHPRYQLSKMDNPP